MKTKAKIIISIAVCLIILVIGIGVGSVYVAPKDVLNIIFSKIFALETPKHIEPTLVSIIWKIRLPRAFMAFVVGASLAVSGTVMQSVLKNPLASSYTMGISSGAALGASIIIVTGFSIPFIGGLTLPLFGLIFGIITVILATTFAAKIDQNMENITIILTGMILSLFINALLTLIIATSPDNVQRLVFWQMGSFSLKDWSNVIILTPIVVLGIIYLMTFTRELDIMTFGEEQAKAIGVDLKRVKWTLLITSAIITGSAIAFVGIIGFIDLFTPHVVRKVFGSRHKYLIPMSAFFGGGFMVLCDLIARTIISPQELPIGAVTAIIGAPFFAYIYIARRKGGNKNA